MECILPSEAARLVLGYLFEQEQCLPVAKSFLESSVHLAECRKLAQCNRDIQTEIHGYSLDDLLDEFCILNTLIIEATESRNIQVLPAAKLSEKLKALLIDHNESSTSCEGSSRKRKRGRISFPTTGTDISQESRFTAPATFPDSSQTVELPIFTTATPSKQLPLRSSFSMVKRRSAVGSTPNKSQTRTDNEISDDTMLDFSEIFSRTLDNKELHESLASSINKALTQEPAPSPDRELDSVVRNVVNNTQSDPCFERFLDEIIAGPSADCAGGSVNPPSPQPPQLNQGRRKPANPEAGIKTRLRSRTMTFNDIVQQATKESPVKEAVPQASLQATVSYTVPLMPSVPNPDPSASRVTVLPSLDHAGGLPSLADISAIQTVFIGGLANYDQTHPGMPGQPPLKRWKKTSEGLIKILPKPVGRPRRTQPAERPVVPRSESPWRKSNSPCGRKSNSPRGRLPKPKKGSRKNTKAALKPKTPVKLSTITVLPSPPESPPPVSLSSLPLIINSPVRSMPVVRNLHVISAQPPAVSLPHTMTQQPFISQTPIVAQGPIVAQPSVVAQTPIIAQTPIVAQPSIVAQTAIAQQSIVAPPVIAPPIGKTPVQVSKRPAPNLVKRRSVEIFSDTTAPRVDDPLEDPLAIEVQPRGSLLASNSLQPALVLFDVLNCDKDSNVGSSCANQNVVTHGVKRKTVTSDDGAVPSTSYVKTRKGRKAVPTKSKSTIKVVAEKNTDPISVAPNNAVGDGDTARVTGDVSVNNKMPVLASGPDKTDDVAVCASATTNSEKTDQNGNKTVDNNIALTTGAPVNSLTEENRTTLPSTVNKSTIDCAKPSTSEETNNIIVDENVSTSKSTSEKASEACSTITTLVSSDKDASKVTPVATDPAVLSTSSGKTGRTPKQRKKCLSTPRRGRPHVRALDFSTPPKPRGALTSPKAKRKTPPRRPPNRKALLFRSPEPIREEEEPVQEEPVREEPAPVVLKPIITEQEETDKAVESICAIEEFLAANVNVSTSEDVERVGDALNTSAIDEILDPRELLESSSDAPDALTTSKRSATKPSGGDARNSREIGDNCQAEMLENISPVAKAVTENNSTIETSLENNVEPATSEVQGEDGVPGNTAGTAGPTTWLERTSTPLKDIIASPTPTPMEDSPLDNSPSTKTVTVMVIPHQPLFMPSVDNSVEAQIKSYVIGRAPIATRVPTSPLSSAWDRHTGVGSIIAAESPKKPSAAWDAALRSLATPSKIAPREDSDDSTCSCDPKPSSSRKRDKETAAGRLLAKRLAKTPSKTNPASKSAKKSKKRTPTKQKTKPKKPAKQSSPGTVKKVSAIEEQFAATSLDDSVTESEISPQSIRSTRSSKRMFDKQENTKQDNVPKITSPRGKTPMKGKTLKKGKTPKKEKPAVELSEIDIRLAAEMTQRVSALLAEKKGAIDTADDELVIDEDADGRCSRISSHRSSECQLRLSSSDEEDTNVTVKRPPSVLKEFVELARMQPLTRPQPPSIPKTTRVNKGNSQWEETVTYADNGPKKQPIKDKTDLSSWNNVYFMDFEGEEEEVKVSLTVQPFQILFRLNVEERGKTNGGKLPPKVTKQKAEANKNLLLARMQPSTRPQPPSIPVTTRVNKRNNEWEETVTYADNGPKKQATKDNTELSSWNNVYFVEEEGMEEEVQVSLTMSSFQTLFSIDMDDRGKTNGQMQLVGKPNALKQKHGAGENVEQPGKNRSEEELDPQELLKTVDLDKFLAAVHGESRK